jgi:integrase
MCSGLSRPKTTDSKNQNGTTSILTLEERMRGVAVNFRVRLEAVVLAGDTLPKISPHDLRHTRGTLWLRKDVRLEVVSIVLFVLKHVNIC